MRKQWIEGQDLRAMRMITVWSWKKRKLRSSNYNFSLITDRLYV